MKNFLFFLIAVMTLLLAACIAKIPLPPDGEHNEPPDVPNTDFKITAKVENGSAYNSSIKRVRAVIYYGNNDDDEYVLTSANYTDGGFTLNLPASVNSRYLTSNGSANLAIIDLEGFSSSSGSYNFNHYVDDFIYGKIDLNAYSATIVYYMYADRDVTIKNSDNKTSFNMSLKKGWNMVYSTILLSGSYTTFETVGVSGLRWYASEDFGAGFFGANAKDGRLRERQSVWQAQEQRRKRRAALTCEN